ncbi:MAG: hypothetical protein IJT23_09915 [Clostridia bacterium]|nr:hypothetical protein [Clostridia bacterium]
MKLFKRITTAALALALGVTTLGISGCSETTELDINNPVITIMLPTFAVKSADTDSPVVKAIEEFCAKEMGVDSLKLNIKWAANSNYGEKVTAAMGSNNWPHLMLVTSRTSTIIQNSRADSFWDLTDLIKETTTNDKGETVYKYPNLASTDDMINHNISVDGKVYGLYRAREVGRAGVTVRKDWIDKLHAKGALSFGSDHINDMTMAEFEEMLYAFKNNDPDGNGQNDTYGMIVAGADYLSGPLENLAVWNGSPNAWGYNEKSGQIEPSYMFDEYVDTLTLMRKWVAEGVINSNIATFNSGDWNNPFLQGQAGVIIDVADRARRVAANMQELNPEAEVDVFGFVAKSADVEPRTLPTTGYSGYFVLPTASIKTEEERDFMLKFMDVVSSTYVANLLNYGIRGESYEESKDGDKKIVTVSPAGTHYAVIDNPDGTHSAIKSTDAARIAEYQDLNQFGTGYDGPRNDVYLTTYYSTDVAKTVDKVYKYNKLFKVPNFAEAYISPTYSRHSTQLDAIMSAATTKYVSGAITLDAWKAERDRWFNQGGEKVIKEMNESYNLDEDKLTDETVKEANHKLQYEQGFTKWLTADEMAKFAAADVIGD